jgi:hypothetical protein
VPYIRGLYSVYDVATNGSDYVNDVREGRGMQCMITDQRTQTLPHTYTCTSAEYTNRYFLIVWRVRQG